MTTDAGIVAAIDRAAELELLPRLLAERSRPVPPPPQAERLDPTLRQQLVELMLLIREALGFSRVPRVLVAA